MVKQKYRRFITHSVPQKIPKYYCTIDADQLTYYDHACCFAVSHILRVTE